MAIDPIIKDHQLWIGFVQPEGLVVTPYTLDKAGAVLSRNVGAQQEILRRHVFQDFNGNLRLKNFPAFTQEFWGWRESDLATPPADLSARLSEYGETLRPTWVVPGAAKIGSEAQAQHLILVEELASGSDFDKASTQSEDHRWHASPQARFERLLRETGVSIGLLTSPERIRLVYAPKGESSGHVTFPIHQMTMAANWPMLAALHLLLHSDRLFIGPENQRLPAILKTSREYQNTVSIRLAGQVLRALNELVRGFHEADRAAHGTILREALQHDPNHIYGGLLTTLMRMVFVLYAEDRSLMGSDETWLQNYSISGLYERLRADAGQYPDTMDSRYGAWAQIITLTRLLYDGGGHGSWRLPPRHGGLFDPDAFPFLEGRPWESKRSAAALIEPPLVSDGILFRILQDLLYLDGERISYRALDVEQIGSVYEAMMGFTVETAHGISIGLGSDHLVVNLEDLLTKKPADRPKWLKENAGCEVTGKAIEQLKSADSVDELLAALRRRISKLYLDQNSNPVTVPAGGIYLQPTEERRRSGSHYTPRSLTQPIVKTTLDPVLAQLGDNPTPEQILALKVCDPAMGSGAFLVEACRYLGEKLEKAWIAHDLMPPIPADQDPLLHARRIVAQRCLYGVDKNPFAVNLAKLSLWLATFAKDHPFTFVDHTLRCGDSLVGLTAHQIEAFHWQPKEEGALLRDLPSRLRHILNARAQILDAADETPYETLAQKLAVTEEQMIDLRLAGDLTVAAFFAADKPNDRETRRKDLAEKFRRARERVTDLDLDDELERAVRVLKTGPKGVTPFHWELEYPEVFRLNARGSQALGFDAIIGNPPFLGGKQIAPALGDRYLSSLKYLVSAKIGSPDLVAFFLHRMSGLVRKNGTFGLIATMALVNGGTREAGLGSLLKSSFYIIEATSPRMWPGSAAVHFVTVVISKGDKALISRLDGLEVSSIDSHLNPRAEETPPIELASDLVWSRGTTLLGEGFVLTSSERDELLGAEPDSAEVIQPLLGGKDLLDRPDRSPSRFVINFGELSESSARKFPAAFRRVEDLVKPQRDRLTRQIHESCFWKHWDKRSSLYAALSCSPTAIAFSMVSKYIIYDMVSTGSAISAIVFSDRLGVIASHRYALFAIFQSQANISWATKYSNRRGETLSSPIGACLGTLALPWDWGQDARLEAAGKAYHEFRTTLLIQNNEGLTKTYNRFHDPAERHPDICELRNLHTAMDRAVLDAYAWGDIQPRYDFMEDSEGEQEYPACSHRKTYRYRWVDADRDEVLARLLELNRTRAEEEAQSAAATPAVNTPSRRGRKSTNGAQVASPNLFDVQEPTE